MVLILIWFDFDMNDNDDMIGAHRYKLSFNDDQNKIFMSTSMIVFFYPIFVWIFAERSNAQGLNKTGILKTQFF